MHWNRTLRLFLFVFLIKKCRNLLIPSDQTNRSQDDSWLISKENLLGNPVIFSKFLRNKTYHSVIFIKCPGTLN